MACCQLRPQVKAKASAQLREKRAEYQRKQEQVRCRAGNDMRMRNGCVLAKSGIPAHVVFNAIVNSRTRHSNFSLPNPPPPNVIIICCCSVQLQEAKLRERERIQREIEEMKVKSLIPSRLLVEEGGTGFCFSFSFCFFEVFFFFFCSERLCAHARV